MINDDDIYLFEEHSSTLPVWWERKNSAGHGKTRTVVYLDAHLDLQQISPESLDRLRACETIDQVKNLEAPNHLNPANRFSFGIENFLYAAHKLDLVDRLIWVAPPHIPRDYSKSLLDYIQQMDGITFAELSGFKRTPSGALRGKLLGLDITICDYQALKGLQIEEGYYLDVDIDYFVDVPADQLWIDPAHVINQILQQVGQPELVTVSRAVTSGFTPLSFRFIGDYVVSLLNKNQSDLDYYGKLYSAIEDLTQGHFESGQLTCQQLLEQRPELPHAYYIKAISGTSERKNTLLAQAQAVDEAYAFDLARESIGLLNRKKNLDKNQLQKLLIALNNLELNQQQRQQAEVALAQVSAAAGLAQAAMELLAKQIGDYADHPDIALILAASQMQQSGLREQCRSLLEMASGHEKNATSAQLYLGDLAFAEENYSVAKEHYQTAHQRASAWIVPLDRLRNCYEKLADETQASKISATIEKRLTTLESLIA
ncbi:MAG: hypothetical protein ACI9FR_002322 [Cryomorphaceae bacterium]